MLHQLACIDRQLGLAADADRQVAHRPIVFEIDAVDRLALRGARGGRRRHDADAGLWLCGEGAGAITGQAIAVAGGEI